MATATRGVTRQASRGAKGPSGRDQRVDILRWFALFSMFVAHCAPGPGPLRVCNLSEFLTAPLFAFLIGVGGQLGDRGWGALPKTWVRAGVRACVLVALGLWLQTWGSQVDIVLAYLALPVLCAPLIARLPSMAVAVLAGGCWAASPELLQNFRMKPWEALAHHDKVGYNLWQVTLAGQHYRFTALIVYVCLGVLVWRAVKGANSKLHLALGGLACLAVTVALLGAKELGRISFDPYEGSHLEIFHNMCFVSGVALLWFAVAPRSINLPALADGGSMTLSVYTIQIIYLTWYVVDFRPGQSDDSWANIVILTLMSIIFPVLWRSIVRKKPWDAGPIEGPTAFVNQLFR